MFRLRNLAAGIRTLLRKERSETEMSDELQAYLDAAIKDKVRSGMSPEGAWRAARIEMGSMEAVKEGIRSQGWESRIEALAQDLRYGLRQLRRSPGFAAAAVLTLALGIGANTAIFSVIDAALLRPLPYDRPEQLVSLSMMHLNGNPTVIAPDFKVWQAQSAVFDSIGAFGLGWNRYSSGANLTGASEAAHVHVHSVTPDFFPMLGVRPILGRGFGPDEAQAGHNQVALLSAATWRRDFGGDRSVINRTIHLDGMPYTVVGVMPPGLLYPPGDLWVPLVLDTSNSLPQSADWSMLDVIGRLKPGVSVAKARADLEVLTHRLDAQYAPGRRKGRSRWRVEVVPLRQVLAGDSGPLLFILLAAVGFVLLIACANLANLLLARAAARSREIAVRAALGARRSRLIRQLLVESGLLAASGGGIGCLVGLWGERALRQLIPPELPADAGLDLRILVFVIGISACAVLLFGVLPALLTSRVDVIEALKEGGERAGSGRGMSRLRGMLVVTEMALALVLLTGAGLLAQSVLRLTRVDLGLDPHHLLLGEAYLPVTLVDQPQRQSTFFHEALERLQSLPGVEAAAVTTHYPVSIFNGLASGVQVSGGPPPEPNQAVSLASISPDFFKTLGIPLREAASLTRRIRLPGARS